MRLGICIKGVWKDELFGVELPGRGHGRIVHLNLHMDLLKIILILMKITLSNFFLSIHINTVHIYRNLLLRSY